MAPQQTALPRLTLNRLFIEDLMAAQPPCFAMGYVEIQGSVTGFIAVRPKNPIPSRSTDQGFRLGHAVLGNATHQVLQFGFEFYGHTTYHALVNPSNPIVQAVIARMLATKDYFFFAINPDQSVIAFRSHLEDENMMGLRTNQEHFKDAQCPSEHYERAVKAFSLNPHPPGQVMEWVCRHNWEYLNLTKHRLDLNPSP